MKKKVWVQKGIGITVIAALGIGLLFGKTDMEQAFAATGPVEINETNFPDAIFRNYVKTTCDTNGDNELSTDEISNYGVYFDIRNMGITSLKGIEYFDNLQWLYVDGNNLTSLDVSKNEMLKELYCANNQLSSLDISNNSILQKVECNDNNLSSLIVGESTLLTNIHCQNNKIQSIDISKCSALSVLDVSNNELTSLNVKEKDRPGTLSRLNCSNNQLSSLDLDDYRIALIGGLLCTGNQITGTLYENADGCYIDLSAYSLDGDKVVNVGTGSYNAVDGRIELQNALEVGDSVTYDYTTGFGQNTMTVTVVIASVVDATASTTEDSATENTTEQPTTGGTTTEAPTTGGSATETPTTEGTVAASTTDSASGAGVGTTAASEQKNTPKTGDAAIPVWIGILGILGMVNYLVARKKRG